MLFSGTIAEENGIFEAISISKQLHDINPGYSLSIIGCCHNTGLNKKLKEMAKRLSFISLNISVEPIDYEIIAKEIMNVDIGLICYHHQPNFINKIPTKLYEYLSMGLPILIQNNKSWTELCSKYKSAISLDFKDIQAIEINQIIQSNSFYYLENIDNADLLWPSCEEQLINSIKNIA